MVSPLRLATWIKNNLELTEWEEGKQGGFVATINGATVQVNAGILRLAARDLENPQKILQDMIRAPRPQTKIPFRRFREWFRTKIFRKPARVKNNAERGQEQLYETIAEIVSYAAQQCVKRYERSTHEQYQVNNDLRDKIFEQLTGEREY